MLAGVFENPREILVSDGEVAIDLRDQCRVEFLVPSVDGDASRSGTMTSIGSNAMARSRNRTERPWIGDTIFSAFLTIPQCSFTIDGLAGDTQPASRFVLIAACLPEYRENMALLHIGETVGCCAFVPARLPSEIVGEHAKDQVRSIRLRSSRTLPGSRSARAPRARSRRWEPTACRVVAKACP